MQQTYRPKLAVCLSIPRIATSRFECLSVGIHQLKAILEMRVRLRKLQNFLFLQITDTGLVALSEQNRGIEILILNYGKFTDCAMIKAISYLSRLKRLSLHVRIKE